MIHFRCFSFLSDILLLFLTCDNMRYFEHCVCVFHVDTENTDAVHSFWYHLKWALTDSSGETHSPTVHPRRTLAWDSTSHRPVSVCAEYNKSEKIAIYQNQQSFDHIMCPETVQYHQLTTSFTRIGDTLLSRCLSRSSKHDQMLRPSWWRHNIKDRLTGSAGESFYFWH